MKKKCPHCEGNGWVTYQKDVSYGLCMGQELDFKVCPDCNGKEVRGLEVSGEVGTLSAYVEARFDSR